MAEQVIPTKKMPPGLQVENIDDRIMTLNVGPQHPWFWTYENYCKD